jgi:hypothetical protein
MLLYLTNLLKKILPNKTAQSDLEQFLLSKNVKTTGDIEHWQRQYDSNLNKGWL